MPENAVLIFLHAERTVLGADPLAVIAFEIILNGSATFNHGNVALPKRLDRILRWIIVTPDIHRIHHSALKAETDSNYGFSVSCRTRSCRTYRTEPQPSQTEMPIGPAPFKKPTRPRFRQVSEPAISDIETRLNSTPVNEWIVDRSD